MRPRRDTQTDTQTRVTTIHFSRGLRLTRNVVNCVLATVTLRLAQLDLRSLAKIRHKAKFGV